MDRRLSGLVVLVVVLTVLVLGSAGCGEEGKVATRPKTVPAGEVSVDIYFMDGEEGTAVVRKVEKGGAEEALIELLKGPTDGEKQEGLFSPIPVDTRLNSYAVDGDVAKVDFSSELLDFGGGSAAVRGITTEINKTVLANDSRVSTVEITIDGQPADEVLQP